MPVSDSVETCATRIPGAPVEPARRRAAAARRRRLSVRRDAAARRATGVARRDRGGRQRRTARCFLVAQRSADTEEPAAGDLHRVGVVARIVQATRQPNGTARILVEGVARARVTRYVPASGYLRAALDDDSRSTTGDDPDALQRASRDACSRCSRSTSRCTAAFRTRSWRSSRAPTRSARQAYGIAAHLARARRDVGRRCSRRRRSRAAARCAQPGAGERDRAASSRAKARRRGARLALPEPARVLSAGAAQGDSPRARTGRRRRRRTTSSAQIEARKLPESGARRARCARCASCAACRRCRRNRRSPATSSTGSSRCPGPSAPTTCSTSRTRAAFSTRITTGSRR